MTFVAYVRKEQRAKSKEQRAKEQRAKSKERADGGLR
jgi:hypothetical protein